MDGGIRIIYSRSSLIGSRSSWSSVDPLSDVLALLKPQSYLTAGMDMGRRVGAPFREPAGHDQVLRRHHR